MAVSGLRSSGLPLFHHHHHHHLHARFPLPPPSFAKLNGTRSKSKGFVLFARYAQSQDLFSSRRFQGPFFPPPSTHSLTSFNKLGKLRLIIGDQEKN